MPADRAEMEIERADKSSLHVSDALVPGPVGSQVLHLLHYVHCCFGSVLPALRRSGGQPHERLFSGERLAGETDRGVVHGVVVVRRVRGPESGRTATRRRRTGVEILRGTRDLLAAGVDRRLSLSSGREEVLVEHVIRDGSANEI